MEPDLQCRALNVSDEKRCEETATSSNGLFCSFHSHQCYGLYRGYKKRNARLDKLSESQPKYLAETKIPLSTNVFSDVEKEEVCHEIHDWLFLKYQLLDRVIRARKLHTTRFYSLNLDYGHEKFVSSLQGQKATIAKALERIERRTAEVLYKNQKWFKWVRQCQDHEEAHREKEQKRVKQEAAMFKRHWKATEERLKELRSKEDQKKQDAFLEKAYLERMAEQIDDDDDDNSDWDPIEDVLENSRGNFIDLIHRFLWMVAVEEKSNVDVELSSASSSNVEIVPEPVDQLDIESGLQNGADTAKTLMGKGEVKPASVEDEADSLDKCDGLTTSVDGTATTDVVKPSHSKKSKPKVKRKGGTKAPKKKPASPKDSENAVPATSSHALASSKGKKPETATETIQEPDRTSIETREEMHSRLKNGTLYNPDKIGGRMVGSIENPVIMDRTITFDDDEIQKLLGEVSEVKNLLFCRLLLGHAALLPAALRANSVAEFLSDEEVTASDLRDLCLKMENPGLQEIRDACADLFRSEDEQEDQEETPAVTVDSDPKPDDGIPDEMIFKLKRKKGDLPEKWISKREKEENKKNPKQNMIEAFGQGDTGTAVDFGEIDDNKNLEKKKIRVKVCGRSIWNYPSDRAMNRGGWLHFCIIAKDSNLQEAVQLCRHWDEFFELNILAIWQYFPGANWAEWAGNTYRRQMLQLGFVMYMDSAHPDAQELTSKFQESGRNGFRKSHAVSEARNFMCAHIKRDDQVSRRLIQYLSMNTHDLLVLVRDAESGRLLIKPPEEQRWLYRQKRGLGRAAKNDWAIIKQIGPEFFDQMDKFRSWSFSFKEYYDIYVWDLEPGLPFPVLYNTVQELLFKALRCTSGADIYKPSAAVLKTLFRDENTHRIRDIRPGDNVKSIYDDVTDSNARYVFSKLPGLDSDVKEVNGKLVRLMEEITPPRHLWYNEADALEDRVLFPEEQSGDGMNPLAIGKIEPLQIWEEEGFSLKKFVHNQMFDSDSDYDTDSNPDLLDSDDESKIDYEEEDISPNFEDIDEDDMDPDFEDVDEDDEAESYPKELRDLVKKMLAKVKNEPERDPTDPRVMHEDFMAYLDKEKARIFKEVWHKADTEPHAQLHYLQMRQMAKYSRRWNQLKLSSPASILNFKILEWLNFPTGQDAKDLNKAIAKVSPFFLPEFLDTERGEQFKNSLMFNQEERAIHLPDIRSHTSNTFRSEEFWEEWNATTAKMEDIDDLDAIPEYMDVAIRPIIAHLYKSGVIRNRPDLHFEGQAMAGKDADKDKYDLFIDWRPSIPTVRMPPNVEDPAKVPAFKTTAKAFALKNPNARFAILKLWSAPYFYPLMIGFDNHDPTSFRDLYGRRWIWMFVPKDMPNSETSIHISASMRIKPFKRQFKDRVVCKRDAYLVMGEDEKDLFKYVSATTYAIQNRPWRWEVDLWKSWVNVDMAFLDKLDDRWLA